MAARYTVLGSTGMVGRAIERALEGHGAMYMSPHRDLRRAKALTLEESLRGTEVVFLCAASVGGIQANIDRPVDMLRDNLLIQANVIELCHELRAKLIFFGSSCIYPRDCRQPMHEEDLLTGPLEQTNEAYAIAKISGIKLCEAYAKQYGLNYLAVMPCNLYGPYDNFRDDHSHFVPALIRKLHAAKESGGPVTLWGSGQARRELMHVDDLAQAVLHLVDRSASGVINIGADWDDSIAAIANVAAEVIGYRGEILWDQSKPDGVARKLLHLGRLRAYEWNGARSWAEGCRDTYKWYLENK
jgi:GDP-L-fucose synthase